MARLVLLRHGQSAWNRSNRFTGWYDVDLTLKGRREARWAGQELRKAGLTFDIAYTSLLKRSIRTLWLVLDELDQMWIPIKKNWQLNERHYGALQGLDKSLMAAQYGQAQVFAWRRSYDIPPPLLDLDDPRHPRHDPRYAHVPPELLPAGESLKQTLERVLPYWTGEIMARLRAGQRVLVVAHGNSLRALLKHLDQIPDDQIAGLNVPTGVPLIYELDEQLQPARRDYLGDEAVVQAAKAAAARAAQVR